MPRATPMLGETEESSMSKKITRRRFLVLGGGAGLSAFLGGAYVVSACPLSDTGVCVGPCAAYIDQHGDGVCDRVYADGAWAQAIAQEPGGEDTRAAEAPLTRCPLGLVGDPYPGECQHYIDQDGDGICDLSQAVGQASLPDNDAGQAPSQTPARVLPDTAVGQASPPDTNPDQTFTVACPFGIVNDPYPGKCRRYVDRDGDGICDLSVPQAVAQAPLPDDDAGQASPTPSAPQPQSGVACPYGLVNDPYPGQCRRYVDLNGDGICDLSALGSGLTAPEAEAQEGRQGRRRGRGNGQR
jgi:hypothetical protein